MICWRTQRKPLIALVCLLVLFTLLLGPMESMVKQFNVDDSSFIGSIIKETEQDNQYLTAAQSERFKDRRGVNESQYNKYPPSQELVHRREDTAIIKSKTQTHWQTHMKKECEKMGVFDPLTEKNFDVDLFRHILVDDEHKVIYCQIPKVATVTWRRIFIISSGQANTTDPRALAPVDIYGKYDEGLQYLSDLQPEEIKYKLRHYFKFMFVREPMERLLSAFRNKMLERVKSSDFFRLTLGKKIAQDYRPLPKVKNINPNDPGVLFNEFVQYLIDRNRKVPWNEHWDKYHHLCFPCTIPYDYVGKLENSQRDANYVLRKTGLSRIALFPNRTDSNYKTKQTKDILKKYYSTLALSDLRNLVKEYELDRRLFGYKLPDIIQELLHKF